MSATILDFKESGYAMLCKSSIESWQAFFLVLKTGTVSLLESGNLPWEQQAKINFALLAI
jgi:hypothetical protein